MAAPAATALTALLNSQPPEANGVCCGATAGVQGTESPVGG